MYKGHKTVIFNIQEKQWFHDFILNTELKNLPAVEWTIKQSSENTKLIEHLSY